MLVSSPELLMRTARTALLILTLTDTDTSTLLAQSLPPTLVDFC